MQQRLSTQMPNFRTERGSTPSDSGHFVPALTSFLEER
ncbi:hypothetical protein AVDCRST_MAG94-4211 [uncultured Leptolyngbya sp.]|uniref:Uncharacterized protein n=1 Tax=uncultured Leptolyngbya sp. TaxID=332963 RepID=A0A6J4MXB1_9CYAN|nr:hypothetical protein AVDCRST_MAG94-4211 [uncultured Leptolyngbya sp.]